MAKGSQVLAMLCPDSQYVITNDDYDSIIWISGKQITKAQFEAGFVTYDAWKAEQDAAKAAQKQALLNRLGITEDEAKLLLGGN